MPLVPAHAIVPQARAAGRGVGAFNVIGIEHAEALVLGAEAAGTPVILAISENCVRYHGGLEPIAAATLALARGAAVPASVHLDHAETEALIEEAIALGIPSVMFDASRLLVRGERGAHARPWSAPPTRRASGWRRSWARSAARTASTRPAPARTPPRRPPTSRRPASTRWPWPWVRATR